MLFNTFTMSGMFRSQMWRLFGSGANSMAALKRVNTVCVTSDSVPIVVPIISDANIINATWRLERVMVENKRWI